MTFSLQELATATKQLDTAMNELSQAQLRVERLRSQRTEKLRTDTEWSGTPSMPASIPSMTAVSGQR